VLCTWLLFERRVKWSGTTELLLYALLVAVLAWLDAAMTVRFLSWSLSPAHAKLLATAIGLVLNFAGRRYVVFPQRRSGEWRAAGP
jgi:putative flippase GtrA